MRSIFLTSIPLMSNLPVVIVSYDLDRVQPTRLALLDSAELIRFGAFVAQSILVELLFQRCTMKSQELGSTHELPFLGIESGLQKGRFYDRQ